MLGEAVGFGRALRAARLAVDLGAAADFARALTLVDIGDREQVRGAGAAIFTRRRDDREIYDAVFERWWRRRASRMPGTFEPPSMPDPHAPAEAEEGRRRPARSAASRPSSQRPDERGVPIPSSGDDEDDESPIEGIVVAPDAYSQGEVLRHREFDRMTPAELREAERLVDALVPHLERRRTRRYELHSHGRRLAPRAMFRRNLGTGGQFVDWVWRRPIREPRSLVVICDISGSMERHSRLLLRFVQALSAASEVRTESFVFGTRLTRVTRLLRDRDRDRALGRVSDAVNDWAGGTRIGESFRTFNQKWARRTLRTSGVVIVVSDGWDRGDPALVATETARLRRNCHRLDLAQPAGRHARLPAARRRDAGGLSVHRRLPRRRDRREPGTPGRDPRRRPGDRHPSGQRGGRPCGTPRRGRAGRPGGAGRRGRHADRSIRTEADPMKELLDTLDTWTGDGVDIGRAVVVRTFGSAPRPEGAVLLYAADGRIAGSVSGGCVEGAAAEEIDKARASGHARVIRYGISDEQAWDVGLACGGTIDVLVEPVAPAAVVAAARASLGAGGHGSAVVTPLPADSPPGVFGPHEPGEGAPPVPELVLHDDGRLEGSLGSPELDGQLVEAAGEALKRGLSRTVELGGRSLFVEVFPVRPRLVVVGAVEVARSLVRLARELGFETVVIDGRSSFATPERFPDVDRLIVGWPDEVADEIGLGPNDAVAVLTHDVKFDEPAIVEALRRGCRYVGAVGSKKTQGDRRARLLEAGVSESELAKLRGPVGLDLGGRAPAETALAILAEIVAERYGGSGVPLRQRAVA